MSEQIGKIKFTKQGVVLVGYADLPVVGRKEVTETMSYQDFKLVGNMSISVKPITEDGQLKSIDLEITGLFGQSNKLSIAPVAPVLQRRPRLRSQYMFMKSKITDKPFSRVQSINGYTYRIFDVDDDYILEKEESSNMTMYSIKKTVVYKMTAFLRSNPGKRTLTELRDSAGVAVGISWAYYLLVIVLKFPGISVSFDGGTVSIVAA